MNEYEQAALRILEAFKELLRRDAGLARLNARIDAGLATYEDAERLSSLTGRELGELISRELLALFPSGPIPREAAEAILPPALRRNYEVVSKAAERVQKALNDRAGLGLAPVRPEHRQERDDNLITYTATQEDFASDAKHFVQLTENNSMMIVDDAVRDNADFHFGAGLSPRIVRKMRGRACAFCRERAGTFDYSVDMNKEVFRRHPNCHCTVEYNPGNGSRKRQNVHSKEWRNATGTERLRDFAEGKAEQLRAAAREKAERLRGLTEAGSGESSGESVEQRKHIGLEEGPSIGELIRRREQGSKSIENQGIIADRIIKGEYSLKLKHQKYLQHVKDTIQYKQATTSRGKPQSHLYINEKTAQEFIYRYAGTGNARLLNTGFDNVEFVTADRVIGAYFDKGEWHDTDRFQIIYGKTGSHIVPTNRQ